MTTQPLSPPIFDGHNDVLLKLFRLGGTAAAPRFLSGLDGHLDAGKCRDGGMGGGFFAVFVPSPLDAEDEFALMTSSRYDLPLPEPIDWPAATRVALSQIATLLELERLGALTICTTAAQVRQCFADGRLAAVLHLEGAEAIDPDLHALDVFHRLGLRSLGPVWSRPNAFGHGVPFRYPSDGDTGPGLTSKGIDLVRKCDERGIIVDLSHITEAGFWDVAKHSARPLVATHSNAHALCPTARNLTDAQLRAIGESGGVVGVNFAVAFLREDGRMVDTDMNQIVRHLDYLVEKVGEDGVAFGSDFDGAIVPGELGSAAGLPRLRQVLIDHGYGAPLLEKLCNGNWLRIIELANGE